MLNADSKNCVTLSRKNMQTVDLNCDIGEGCGNDTELMSYVSSVNIACGFHAGDAATMRKTVEKAIEKGVAIGAHPSYPDREGFGRRAMSMPPDEVFDIVLYQVATLKSICDDLGVKLHHVKPHGALYNQSASDKKLAKAIVAAVKKINDELLIYGLSGGYLISEAESIGLHAASEVFADRTYMADGSLTLRTDPNALITDPEKSAAQVLQMVNSQSVTAINGETVHLKSDTICIHGDGEHALDFAVVIHKKLNESGIEIRAF